MQIDATHGVEVNLRGEGGEIIGFLPVKVFCRDHLFPAFLKLVQGLTNGLHLVKANRTQIFQI